jgi:hypothetical protein
MGGWQALVAALMVAVPGLGAALVVWRPQEVALVTRAALAVALGMVILGLVGFVLAVARIFDPVTLLVSLAVVTAALWTVALRRHSPREWWTAARRGAAADRLPIVTGGAVIAAFAVVRFLSSPFVHLWDPTAWRYWADGVEIAFAGRIPATVVQYGGPTPTIVNKALLSSMNAGLSVVIGREALPALGALLWVSSVALALALWALGWELGLRRAAVLLPLLLVANDLVLNRELTTDLRAFKAEIVGRAVAACGAAVAVKALRAHDRWKDAAVAGALLGAAAVIHVVPTFVALVVVGWYALGRLAVDRRLGPLVARAGVIVVVAAVAGGTILLVSGGDAAIGGAGSDDSAAAFGPDFDPTLFLNQGIDVVPRPGPHPWYLPPARVAERFTASALGVGGPPLGAVVVLTWILALGGLAAAIVLLVRGPPRLRPLGLVAWGTGATIVALSWVLTLRTLFVPATFGLRRLFDYSSLPIALAVAVAVELALRATSRRSVRGASIAGVAVVAAVAVVLLPTARPPAFPAGADRRIVAAFTWIRTHTGCDARILADQHTEGVFEGLTGRVAVLEGATPYLRPDLLKEVVDRLVRARAFFEHPASDPSFPDDLDATYVVILKEGGVGYPLAARPDEAALASLPSLRRVYGSPAMDVFAVAAPDAPARAPVAGARSFPCLQGPVG